MVVGIVIGLLYLGLGVTAVWAVGDCIRLIGPRK